MSKTLIANELCVVLARGGSKGIPNKNLSLVGGMTLVEIVVRASREAGVKSIIVSSDSDSILETAQTLQTIAHRRSARNSGDFATSEEALMEVLKDFGIDESSDVSIALVQPTSPFVLAKDIRSCLDVIYEGCSSFTAVKTHKYQWLRNGSEFTPIGHSPGIRYPRQKEVLKVHESGSCYAFKAKDFFRNQTRFSRLVHPILVDEERSLEIDTFEDLSAAQGLARRLFVDNFIARGMQLPKLIITDFDGCLTNNYVFLNTEGVETIALNRLDGLYIGLIRDVLGIEIEVVTAEKNPVVLKRCEKLKIKAHVGVQDKYAKVSEVLRHKKIGWNEVWYVGDEINDLEAIKASGFALCPSNANYIIRDYVDQILTINGGDGIFLQIYELLKKVQK